MDTKKSKQLSHILRHHPEKFNIKLDKYGYAKIIDITNNTNMTADDIKIITRENDKQRFIYDKTGTQIRATQGHSIDIEFVLKKLNPKKYLFHGTSSNNLLSIQRNGLNKMSRHHVHLSDDPDTALTVGQRHGHRQAIVLKINTFQMITDNFSFYKTENNVWLIDNIPNKYISQINKDVTQNVGCSGVIVFNKDRTKTVLVKANNWGFPKGKKNQNETSIQTALRELYEETGLTIEDITIPDLTTVFTELSHNGNPSVKLFIGFLIGNDKPVKFRDGDTIIEVKWVSLKEADTLLDHKNRRDIFSNAIKYIGK
jgi:putative RNA 2'-phosphotransferase